MCLRAREGASCTDMTAKGAAPLLLMWVGRLEGWRGRGACRRRGELNRREIRSGEVS